MKSRTAVYLSVMIVAVAASAAAQSYTITDLGVLKGDNESSGFFINNLGEVVGCSDTQTANAYPCTGTVAGQPPTNFVAVQWSLSGEITVMGTLSAGGSSAVFQINSAEE